MPNTPHPVLSPFWASLCSWDGPSAAWAVRALRKAIEDQGAEEPGAPFTALLSDLEDIALGFVRGGGTASGSSPSPVIGDTERVLGGIRTLEALVQVGDGQAASSETRAAGGAERRRALAKELGKILKSGGDVVPAGPKGGRMSLIEIVSGAVGVLARACSGEMHVLDREFAVPAMEMINAPGPKGESQRYAVVLVLRELAEHAPPVLYDRRMEVLEKIWLVINDLSSTLRIRAAAALGAMLQLVHERQSTPKYYRFVLDKVEEGFEHGTTERIHGSLLAIRQLLRYPGPWMAHRLQRRRRRPRRNTDDPALLGFGNASAAGTPFAGAGASAGGSSGSVRGGAPQMLLPPVRVGAGGAGSDGSRLHVATPSGAPSTGGSTAATKTRGFFFPAGFQIAAEAGSAHGAAGAGGSSHRGVVPPPPSPHHVPPPGTPLHVAAWSGVGYGSGAAPALSAAAVAAMAEEEQEMDYRALCGKVLAKKEHKEVAVRRTVMALLPELVVFYPGGTKDLMEPTVWFLVHTLRQGQRSDRGLAYLSLARLGLAAGPDLWREVPNLWHSVRGVVKDGLAEDRNEFCPQALACLEMIVIIVSASAAIDLATAAAAAEEAEEAAEAAAAAEAELTSGAGRVSPTMPPPFTPSSSPANRKKSPTLGVGGAADTEPLGSSTAASGGGVFRREDTAIAATASDPPVAMAAPSEPSSSSSPPPRPSSATGALDVPTEEAHSLTPAPTEQEQLPRPDSNAAVAAQARAPATAKVTALDAAASAALEPERVAGRAGLVPDNTAKPAPPAPTKKASVLEENVYELVDRAFNGGLSQALVQTLTVVSERMPALQPGLQARLLRMVANVLQNFVPRPWMLAGASLYPGVGGVFGAAGLSTVPVHGVVGGVEGLSLVCEAPRISRSGSFSSGGGGGGGGGELMWSAEGVRQLETWRNVLFPPPGAKLASSGTSTPHLGREISGGSGTDRWGGSDDALSSAGGGLAENAGDGYGYVYGDGYVYGYSGDDPSPLPPKGNASALAGAAQARLAEKPGRFWELYGSSDEADGAGAAAGNVVIALDVLGSFDFFSLPVGARLARDGGAVAVAVGEDHRQDMLGNAVRLLHLHALRCLDDPDQRVRVAACSACCRLLARAAVAHSRSPDSRASPSSRPLRDSSMGSNGSGLWVGKAIYGRETSSATAATATMTASARSFAGSGASPASSPLSVSLFPGETWTDAGATFARSTSLLLTTLSLSARDVALGGGLEDDEVFGGMDATLAWVRSACAEVLERLLTVGLADEATSVRLEVVIGLEENRALDPLLALSANVQCLFEAINDASLPVRRSAARVIGRVSRLQSAVIVPFVRVALAQLARHLEVSQDATVKKERILVMTDLLASAGSLVRPYVSSVMPHLLRELQGSARGGLRVSFLHEQESLTPTAQQGSGGVSAGGGGTKAPVSSVVTAVLRAMGVLSVVSPRDVLPVLDDVLLPAIVRALQDHTSAVKQEAAVKALGQVVGATGAVVVPYFSHPQLLQTMLAALQRGGKTTDGLRLEVLKTVGILGVPDPVKLRLYRLKRGADTSGDSRAPPSAGLLMRRSVSGGVERRGSVMSGAGGSAGTGVCGGIGSGGSSGSGVRDAGLDRDHAVLGVRLPSLEVDVVGMLLSPTWSGGVRSGFGTGASLGEGLRGPLSESPQESPPPRKQQQQQSSTQSAPASSFAPVSSFAPALAATGTGAGVVEASSAPPLPRIPRAAMEGDTGKGMGGAARVLLQKAGESAGVNRAGEGIRGGGAGDEGAGDIDAGGRVVVSSEGNSKGGVSAVDSRAFRDTAEGVGGGGGGGSRSRSSTRSSSVSVSVGVGGERSGDDPRGPEDRMERRQRQMSLSVDESFSSASSSSVSPIERSQARAGAVAGASRRGGSLQVWPQVDSEEGGGSKSFPRQSQGEDNPQGTASATATAAASTGEEWGDDGWYEFGAARGGPAGFRGYDLDSGDAFTGALHGAGGGGDGAAGGGGQAVASYMQWGAEGGVWYGDGNPGRGDMHGEGLDQDEQWGQQRAGAFGAPPRWSGVSHVAADYVRPADALGPGLEEHLPFIVTHTLVKVLRDPMLSAHYQSAVETSVKVCCGSGSLPRLTEFALHNTGGAVAPGSFLGSMGPGIGIGGVVGGGGAGAGGIGDGVAGVGFQMGPWAGGQGGEERHPRCRSCCRSW